MLQTKSFALNGLIKGSISVLAFHFQYLGQVLDAVVSAVRATPLWNVAM